jgi:arylsulfatase A-like enzyme
MALDFPLKKPYIRLMSKNEMTAFTTASGASYTYAIERQTQTAYAEFMNPATRYERVYLQVNVFEENGLRVGFAFANIDATPETLTNIARCEAERIEGPADPASMSSRFD